MKIGFKKLTARAVIPTKAHATDAGFDLVATSRIFDREGNATYGTGIAVEIPEGYVGLVFPRSSIFRKDLALSNSVGVIDSGYRGEIMAKFKPTLVHKFWGTNLSNLESRTPLKPRLYDEGERIAQLIIMPIPQVEFVEAEELTPSERGEGGYGSTGN